MRLADHPGDSGASFGMLSRTDLPSLDIHALTQAPDDPEVVEAYVVGHGISSNQWAAV